MSFPRRVFMSLVLVGACGTRAPAPVDAPQLEDAAEVDDLGVDTDVTLDESSAPDTGDEAEVDSPGGDVQDVFDVYAVAMDAFDTPDGSLADTPPDCVVRPAAISSTMPIARYRDAWSRTLKGA